MRTQSYKASPGKFVLVEQYHGDTDKTFPVNSPAEGIKMARGLCASLEGVDAGSHVSYTLFDDQGNEVSWSSS